MLQMTYTAAIAAQMSDVGATWSDEAVRAGSGMPR